MITNPNLQFLQLELARIDSYIRREVRRWQLAGEDPNNPFRGFAISNENIERILTRPFGTSWGQTVTLSAEEENSFNNLIQRLTQKRLDFLQTAQNKGITLQWSQLQTAFNLDQFELDTLLIALAPALDLRYEQIYGFLQDHINRKRPLVNLILTLLGEVGPARLPLIKYFTEDAPLIKYQLLTFTPDPNSTDPSLLSQMLVIDPTLMTWLASEAYQPHKKLGHYAILYKNPADGLDTLLVPEEAQTGLDSIETVLPMVAFIGPDQGCQEMTARLFASHLKRPLLVVDLTHLISDALSPLEAVRLALRDARITGAVPCLFGWDGCLADKKTPAAILNELCEFPHLVLVAGETRWQPGNLTRQRSLFWLKFPVPTYTERLTMWQHFANLAELSTFDPAILNKVAGHFRLTSNQIRDAVFSAKDKITQHQETLQQDHLFEAARSHSNLRLADLAHKITARYSWADLILPLEQVTILKEVVNMVSKRHVVLEEWEVGQKLASSVGIAIIFSGPPGTGKTMAAEVMAGELGLDLYKIDLSSIVSKYIGETEKNLERIFREAEQSNAILFFDEADALFGKRSEVRDSHDRYANVEISYLLQRMETYDGITILATNLKANLDEAFARRLQFAVDFPFPEEPDRLRIWETLFPPQVPRTEQVSLQLMADHFKLSGGNIRNVIVSACYLAARDEESVSMEHLLHATRRELQKIGRLVRDDEMEYLLQRLNGH